MFFHNISTIARYEAKTLRRSWFFRLFSIGAFFIITFMNIGLYSPIGDEDWELMSIPSSLPLMDLYLLNIGQAIVVIFLAADFLKRDKKLDTNEVLYTRPMSNLEYILGKTWGILRLFLGLDIVILAVGMLINFTSKSMTVDFTAYISFLLIICVPTILFSLGLAFLMMSLIRNQAITFLILLGIAALNMFYLWFRMGSLFDYMAFGIPIFKSGMTGFDDPGFIINQRMLYFFLGAAFVFATTLIFKRLPQSGFQSILTVAFLVIFLIIAGKGAFYTYSAYISKINEKKDVLETNRKFENENFASIIHASIDLAHSGESIRATAELVIRNDNDLSLGHYIFSLNPALNILDIKCKNHGINFKRTGHIITIEPPEPLLTGMTDTISVTYEGGISESFCYPENSDNIRNNPYRIVMLNVNKKQAFLKKDYVLLTPETHWYPVASLNYFPSAPARIKVDFTNFLLRLKEEPGLTPISQGRRKSAEGYSIFTNENPLTGLTLVIGRYESDTLRVDSVDYINYHFPGNDYYKKDLPELKDTLKYLVSGIMRELETNFSAKYPFSSLSLVEVPVQFHSYPQKNTQTRSEVQPSMVLLPEKFSTLYNADFSRQFKRQKRNMARNNQIITDKELQVRLFNSFIRNTFISGENFRYINGVASNEPVRYRLGPSFFFFKNNFYSAGYPVINAVFESHLQQVTMPDGSRAGSRRTDLSDNDRANLILKTKSFSELLKDDPSADTLRTVLSLKGDWFFNFLRYKAGTTDFNTWFSDYLNENQFKSIDLKKFDNDINKKFGFGIYPFLGDWYSGNKLPGFSFENLRASEIVINGRTRYQVTFSAGNPFGSAGLIIVSFRTGGTGGIIVSQTGGKESSDISKIVFLDSMQKKKIGILLDFVPRTMVVNTLSSKNIPGLITFQIDEVSKGPENSKPFEGEELVASLNNYKIQSEIIVDNEDPGFKSNSHFVTSPLKKILGVRGKKGDTYQKIRQWTIPEHWQPVIETFYYGDFIRSAVYTRAGAGEREVTWQTPLKGPGYYDISCYIGKTDARFNVKRASGGTGNEDNNEAKDLHYKIFNDYGIEEITVDYEHADAGWNSLGRFYLSSDTAKVSLTNQSSGKYVIGDAIKWSKQE